MKIVFLGAGNLAYHLSKALQKAGHSVLQVYSRTMKAAEELANLLNCKAVNNVKDIIQTADLYIVALSDDAVKTIVEQLDIDTKNIVHTAGSIPIDVLKGAKNYGVFYPLQTFSKNRELVFSNIPICIEADNLNFQEVLLSLANQISENVWLINSEERKYLHLSAVFVCNFVNHIYSLTKQMIDEKNLDFKILYPLIKETVNKALDGSPMLSQTGPAIRNDKKTLAKHINLLSSRHDLSNFYDMMSKSIQNLHKLHN